LKINKKQTDFETSLNAIDFNEVRGQSGQEARATARQYFYEDLKEGYEKKFATQAE
jgi:hypothetical protein